MSWNVELGDCLEVLATLPDCSIDSVVTDPPYELGFMGKKWDSTGIAYRVDLWQHVLRVLKPGGHLLAFSGSRTYHRMAVAIEDAGFQVRDQIMWVYGSGFPKSQDVSKALDKLVGAERVKIRTPAKKGIGSANTVGGDSRGEGRPWIDRAILIGYHEHDGPDPVSDLAKQWQGWGTALKPAHEPIVMARKPLAGTVAQTVQAYGTGAINVDGCRVGPRWPANLIHDGSHEVVGHFPDGSARFFYCPKAGKRDRDEGAGHLQLKRTAKLAGSNTDREDLDPVSERFRTSPSRNHHPTVKPTVLMRYLCRLVTPPGGTVLDPFTGSGSTGKAAVMEGFRFQGIEREAEYSEIAKARITHAEQKSLGNRSGGQCGCGLSGGCGNPICGFSNAGNPGVPAAKFGFGRDFHIGKPGKKLHPEALIQLELPF